MLSVGLRDVAYEHFGYPSTVESTIYSCSRLLGVAGLLLAFIVRRAWAGLLILIFSFNVTSVLFGQKGMMLSKVIACTGYHFDCSLNFNDGCDAYVRACKGNLEEK